MNRLSKRDTSAPRTIKKLPSTHTDSNASNLLPFCYFHTENRIEKFCQCHQCTLPLCYECQPIHLEEHKKNYSRPDIEDYTVVRERAIMEIENRISSLQNNTDKNRQILTLEKQRIDKIINDYFRTLMDKVSIKKDNQAEIQKLEEKLEKIMRGSIKALIKYYSAEGEDQKAFVAEQIPTLNIVQNNQGLIRWLQSTISYNFKQQDSKQIKIQNQNNVQNQNHVVYETQSRPYSNHKPPQQISTHTPIITKPLGENLVIIQPNLPQPVQSEMVAYQKIDSKQSISKPHSNPHPNLYHQNHHQIHLPPQDFHPQQVTRREPSIIKVQNSKENQQRSSSPKMPAVQIWKSKNVLRNSCEIPSSPIKELNSLEHDFTPHARTMEGFNQVKSKQNFNRTEQIHSVKRPMSAVGGSKTITQTAMNSNGFQNINPMIHERNLPVQFAVNQQSNTQSFSQRHIDSVPAAVHLHGHKTFQPQVVHPQQIFVSAPPNAYTFPSTQIQGKHEVKKVLTPEQLQSMIVNKRLPGIIQTKPPVSEHRPSSFALAAVQQKLNPNYHVNSIHQSYESISSPKDFWRAESYFDNERVHQPSSFSQQQNYRINIIQPPKISDTTSYQYSKNDQLKIEDLSTRNKF